jgi:ABC-type lipoprotein export system ATPase subunit
VSKIKIPLLAATGLRKQFQEAGHTVSVLQGVDLQIDTGSSMSIQGASGCGKSTLLNLLAGLEQVDQGQLEWQGSSVQGWSLARLAAARRALIGFVFQAYYLCPELSVLQNVLLAARIDGGLNRQTKKTAQDLLEQVGLADRLHYSVQKLSGGERQRVAIARALINDPPLIMADEPTGNLDESTAAEVMDLLFDLVQEQKKSLLLVTHDGKLAARAERQLTMQGGQLSSTQAQPEA